jgi:hypothetical protein
MLSSSAVHTPIHRYYPLVTTVPTNSFSNADTVHCTWQNCSYTQSFKLRFSRPHTPLSYTFAPYTHQSLECVSWKMSITHAVTGDRNASSTNPASAHAPPSQATPFPATTKKQTAWPIAKTYVHPANGPLSLLQTSFLNLLSPLYLRHRHHRRGLEV